MRVGRVAESSPAIIVIPKNNSRLSADRAAWYIRTCSSLGGGLRAFAQTLAGASIRPLEYRLSNKGRRFLGPQSHEGDIWLEE
jgi:hypothetical protein